MVAAVNIEDPKNHYNLLGINEDKEKVFEDNHSKSIKFVNIGPGIGGGVLKAEEL